MTTSTGSHDEEDVPENEMRVSRDTGVGTDGRADSRLNRGASSRVLKVRRRVRPDNANSLCHVSHLIGDQ